MPDERYDWLNKQYKPKSEVPAHMTVYDIAGLTRGASTGAGLGNAFLSHIRAVDAIFQVVRCFDDAEIIHVEGDVDPVRDLDIISEELRIKDIEFVEKAHENIVKQTKRGGQSLEMKKLKEEQATIEKVLQYLKDGKDVRHGDWSPKEVSKIASFVFHAPSFMMTKSYCSNNPSSSNASPNTTLRGRNEKTSLSDLTISTHIVSADSEDFGVLTTSAIGRGHQSTFPSHSKASRLPHQPQREGLHQEEEQASAKGRRVDQGTRAKRSSHSHFCLFRGALDKI